ncbi:MAG: hypothetical protein ACRC33_08480, partial [Gemmataceae bacterium]
ASLLGAAATDPDGPAALRGVAITAVGTGVAGRWQYSTTNGRTWLNLGPVSDGAARLLRATDRVRFIPVVNANGTTSLTVRAWDQTTSVPDATVNGGSTAFSAGSHAVTLLVAPTNDRPTLDIRPARRLSAGGDAVSAILGGAAADADGTPLGLAVTGFTGNGTWQFSRDGVTWQAFGPTTAAAARLLGPDDRVRFLPRRGFRGVAQLSYRAWDQALGAAGAVRNSAGGSFSAATETAILVVA